MSAESTLLTMLNFIKKTALAILILSSSQFNAYGSDEIAAPPHMLKFREQLGLEYVKLEKCIENYQSQLTDIKDSNGQRRLKASKSLHLNLLLDETNHELKKIKGQIRSYDKANATFPFEDLPKDVRGIIIKYVAADFIATGKRFNELADVNRRWKSELREFVDQDMQPWQPCWRAYLGVTPANEAIYRTFFNATLECRNDPSHKDLAFILPFEPLMNLSVKAFNLPTDIEASKHLVITDKLQRFFAVGGSKGHILFATKAMITMRMKSMNMSVELKAKLDKIIANWDDSVAPVGIFWRWSDDEDLTWFDYLITQDLTSISRVNIFENWKKSELCGNYLDESMFDMYSAEICGNIFHVCFEPQLELQTIGRGK